MSNANKMDIEKKKVKGSECPKFRVSYPNVFKPKGFKDQEPVYSLVMLFDKKTDLTPLKRAVQNAIIEKWGADKAKWPALRSPFRNGDAEKAGVDGYENTIFVTAKNKNPVAIVDKQIQPIAEESRSFYAGCYAKAALLAYAYDNMGNRGVAFSLQSLQKVGDGEEFTSKRKPEEEVVVESDGSDDEAAYGKTEADDGMGF